MLDMYNFIGFRVMFGAKEGLYKSAEYCALGGMALAFGLLLAWGFSKRLQEKVNLQLLTIVRFSMLSQAILGTAFALVAWQGWEGWWLSLLRFFWGFFLGFGLGISLTITTWAFGRLKRTSTITFLVFMGVFGACLSVLLYFALGREPNHWAYAVLPAFLALVPLNWGWLSSQFERFPMPDEKVGGLLSLHLQSHESKAQGGLSRLLWQKKFWRSFVILLLGALNVRFSVQIMMKHDFVGEGKKLLHTEQIDLLFWHYPAFALGVLLAGWLSWRCRSRSLVQIVLSIIGIVGIYVYVHVSMTWGIALLGVFSATWLMTLLQCTETYPKRLHLFVIAALPLFFRLSIELLRFIQENLAINIVHLGYALAILSFLAALLWEDNFQGVNNLQVLEGQSDTNLSVAVLNTATRRKFEKEIDEKLLKNEQVSDFSRKVSDILEERLKEVFDEWLYSFSIGLTEGGQPLKFDDYRLNSPACHDLPRIRDQRPELFPKLAERLIEESNRRFLATHAIEKGWNGIVLTPEKKNGKRDTDDYESNGYNVYDLSSLSIDEADAAAFWASTKGFESNVSETTVELFKRICDQTRPAWAALDSGEKIGKILTLRALDRWRYPEKEYFVYFIIPKSLLREANQQRAALVLHTAVRVPVSKLDELANCMNWLLAQRANALALDAGWRKIWEEQSHSMKTSFGVLKNDTNALNDVRKDPDAFAQKLQAHQTVINRMARINDFTLALMRAGDRTNLQDADDRTAEAFRCEEINLREILVQTLSDFEKSLNEIRFSADGHLLRVQTMLPDLRRAVLADPALNVSIRAVRTGLEIVLDNLVSNMLYNTNYRNPQASISLEKNLERWRLCFLNNGEIEENMLAFIKMHRENPGLPVSQKAGLRTIKRILASALFNPKSSERWLYDAENRSDKQAIIFLSIPSSDFVS